MCSGGQNLTLHILVFAFRGIPFFPPGFPSFIKTPPLPAPRFLCPSKLGGRGAKRRRGSVSFPFSVLIPLRGLFLLVARHNQNKFRFCSRFLRRFRFPFPSSLSLPPRAKRSLRESIEYTFVSFEGSNPHCDARTGRGGSPYILYNKVYSPSSRHLPPFLPLFFAFFLKNLLQPFASLRKSLTFALAKREHLLRVIMEDVFLR